MSPRHRPRDNRPLPERFPASAACSCDICRGYCQRPGWWTVEQATRAVQAGLADRMMLELSPDRRFGVLSPAFPGSEANLALQSFAGQGCTFLQDGLCELFGSGLEPLECRHVHHQRPDSGKRVHAALGRDWDSPAGQALVEAWGQLTGLAARLSRR